MILYQCLDHNKICIQILKRVVLVEFKSLVECLKELLSEVNIDFIEGKGMRLVSIDPGRDLVIYGTSYRMSSAT